MKWTKEEIIQKQNKNLMGLFRRHTGVQVQIQFIMIAGVLFDYNDLVIEPTQFTLIAFRPLGSGLVSENAKTPDGYVVRTPGLPNMAYHHKETAVKECPRYGIVKPFRYLE